MAAKNDFRVPCVAKPEYQQTSGGNDRYPKRSPHTPDVKAKAKSGVLGTPPGNMKPSAL